MVPGPLAHGGLGRHTLEQLALFGSDWAYALVPMAAFAAAGVAIARRSARPASDPLHVRFADGAGRITGLAPWSAATLGVLLAALVIAVIGFFWDVAWHIAIGRDEFLFSPPHICLLVGISLIGVAGALGIVTATRDRAPTVWRVGRWHVPAGPAALSIAGGAALVGFAIDELWHEAYGLDVTMWSPPHLTMISAAAFCGIAAWLTYAESEPRGNRHTRRHVPGFLAGVTLIALSAWQLEYDLGVPQWQQLAQPVLIAVAAGLALTAARAAIGPWGAAIAVAHFLGVRAVLFALTVGAWHFPQPRFPLYLAAAVAVEAAFALRRSPLATGVLAGAGVGTIGLAGEWLVSQVWFHHPWQTAMLPRLGVALVAAVGASVLGTALGRTVTRRAPGIPAIANAVALVGVLAAIAVTLPRITPDATATVRTRAVDASTVHLEVDVAPGAAVTGADRWEAMAWQGGGHVSVPLRQVDADTWRTVEPVPVGGSWKTTVRLASGAHLGGVAVWMPADPEIDAAEVPVVAERTGPMVSDAALLLREAHGGPAWPAIVAYTYVAAAIVALLGTLIAGAVALDRRRRAGEASTTGVDRPLATPAGVR